MLLLIDNYDSFTWNLAHRLGELGAEVRVVRNDAITLDEIEQQAPAQIVISPGPGRPETAGVTVETLRKFGGRAADSRRVPRDTRRSRLRSGAKSCARPRRCTARRHSSPTTGRICSPASRRRSKSDGITRSSFRRTALPQGFVRTSWVVDDGTIMGVRHESWPVFGVQFHPESVLTSTGHRLLQNFLETR